MKPYEFIQGRLPLLISIPHAGTALTEEVAQGLSAAAQGLPDTDWHLPQLYDFVYEMGASVLVANYSRLVIDLNRPADNAALYTTATTGLYPETLFDGTPTFRPAMAPTAAQRQGYLENIWTPYHHKIGEELRRIRQQFGYALLFDAHSIASVIPRLFDGRLPDLNLGTNGGLSCDPRFTARLEDLFAAQSAFSWVVNGRFKGGHITRAWGRPEENIHALQLELAQLNYMNELPPYAWQPQRAVRLQPVLKSIIDALLRP
ncbi:N-formylglutamate deformylase [Erwinia mallotivora]|uniref:N-formylglutamate deformylase n=1 Tax=Erwinia mallotivora TaxID=69222 RepID=UPI0035ECDA42